VNRAPETLRDLGLIERLDATDFGDVSPPPYEDFERPPANLICRSVSIIRGHDTPEVAGGTSVAAPDSA
jgi:hypothetical protein